MSRALAPERAGEQEHEAVEACAGLCASRNRFIEGKLRSLCSVFDGPPWLMNRCAGLGEPMTGDEVLRRYREEWLPEFVGLPLRDVNQVGNFGNTPLKVAAVRGSVEELLGLLDAGASVNSRGEHGYTALHHAIAQGHVEAVRVLVTRGASLTVLTDWGQTPTELARRSGRADIIAALSSPSEAGEGAAG